MSRTLKVRNIEFNSISSYTKLLILHYFPDLKVNEEIVCGNNSYRVKPKKYDYSSIPFKIKDFYLVK